MVAPYICILSLLYVSKHSLTRALSLSVSLQYPAVVYVAVCCVQAAAQASAAQAATGELAASLKSAEARNAALTESLSELQEALERQRAAADLREEMIRQVRE